MNTHDYRIRRMIIALAFLVTCVSVSACFELGQTQEPGSTTVTVTTPTGVTGVEEDAGGMTVTVVPASVTLGVGDTVFAMVIVKNAVGVEVPNKDFTAASRDTAIADVGVEGRQLRVLGVGTGETSADIFTNGLRASLKIVVE